MIRKSVHVFNELRVLYKPSLDRDADYSLVQTSFDFVMHCVWLTLSHSS